MAASSGPRALIAVLTALNVAFEDALHIVGRHCHDLDIANLTASFPKLERCLRQAPRDIEQELEDGLDHFGPAYCCGDGNSPTSNRKFGANSPQKLP